MNIKTMRSVIVTQGFRSQLVTIAGRKYEAEKLTKSSQRRLLAVLENVPAENRCVELERDFTPNVFYYFYKLAPVPHLPVVDLGMFPAAYGRYMPPVQDLDALYTPEQREFNKSIAHKGMSAITDADREAANKVGLTLADFRMTTGCKGWDAPLRLVLPGMRR